jgi:hypothetical protein
MSSFLIIVGLGCSATRLRPCRNKAFVKRSFLELPDNRAFLRLAQPPEHDPKPGNDDSMLQNDDIQALH